MSADMNPQGATTIHGYVNSLADRVMVNPSADSDTGLHWYAALDGLRCGVRDTQLVTSAKSLDAKAQERIDEATNLVAAIPVPVPALSALSSKALQWGANEVIGHGTNLTVGQLSSVAVQKGASASGLAGWSLEHEHATRTTIVTADPQARADIQQWFDNACSQLAKDGINVTGLPAGGNGGGLQATWEDAYDSAAKF